MTLVPERDLDTKVADPVPSAPAIDKRARKILDEADGWGDQIAVVWVRLLKREHKVVAAKLSGSKAREGTRFWDPAPPPHETKAFKVGKFIDTARWLGELEDELTPIYNRLFSSFLDRGAALFEEKGKPRKVRTPEGREKYDQEIGTVIVPDPEGAKKRTGTPAISDFFAGGVDEVWQVPWVKQEGFHTPLYKEFWQDVPEATIDASGLYATQKRIFKRWLEWARQNPGAPAGDFGTLPWVVEYQGKRWVMDGHHRVVEAIERGVSIRVHLLNLDERENKALFEEKGKRARKADRARLAALTAARIAEARDYHEAWLERLTEMAERVAASPNATIEGLIDQIEIRYSKAEEEVDSIAHSHAVGATNEVQLEVVRSLGMKGLKMWYSAKDPRVRDSHALAHGQRRELDKPFKVGGFALDYPGDLSAPPGERINCRCVLLYFPMTATGEPRVGLEAASLWVGLQRDLEHDILGWADRLETKRATPLVRTHAGVRRYKLPLKSPIVRRPHFTAAVADADRWSADSAAPGPWYHGTDDGYAIMDRGFDPNHVGAAYFGRGLYLDRSRAGARNFGKNPLELRVRVHNIAHVKRYGGYEDEADSGYWLFHDLGGDALAKRYVNRIRSGGDDAEINADRETTRLLQELGYDAVMIGDEWLVVLNPKDAVVVDQHYNVPAPSFDFGSGPGLGKAFFLDDLEYKKKLKKVRTPEGRRKYDQEIGEVIVPDLIPGHFRMGSRENPHRTSSASRALQHLAAGDHVELDRPKRATTLLKQLRKIAKDAEARGETAPTYDLCKVTVRDTSLFCADEETEILTANGWKRYNEIAVGDEALTLNHDTGLSEWQQLEHVNVFPAETRLMVAFESTSHSSLTTLDHRWAVTRPDGARRWTTSAKLRWEDRVPVAAPCANLPTEAKYEDPLVELVAWAWTEGTVRGDALRIYQSDRKHPKHCAAIRAALTGLFGSDREELLSIKAAGIPGWRESRNQATGMTSFHLNKLAAAPILAQMDSNKVVHPSFIRSLTAAQLTLFIDRSIDADGHRAATTDSFSQRVEGRNRVFEMACALLGRRTSTCSAPERREGRNSGLRQYTTSVSRSKMIVRPVAMAKTAGISARENVVIHEGIVWCPTTLNGTWFARRRGTVYYTGNCVQSKGIPRIHMPQLTGIPRPGSRADDLLRDQKGKVDLAPYFLEHLAKHGTIVHHDSELASRMIASQNELDGAKVGRMMRRIKRGESVRELFVSDDNYIVDGHHHWAATVGLDASNDLQDKLYMRVARVDMGIVELLKLAKDFAEEWGIGGQGVAETKRVYVRDDEGQFAEVPGTGVLRKLATMADFDTARPATWDRGSDPFNPAEPDGFSRIPRANPPDPSSPRQMVGGTFHRGLSPAAKHMLTGYLGDKGSEQINGRLRHPEKWPAIGEDGQAMFRAFDEMFDLTPDEQTILYRGGTLDDDQSLQVGDVIEDLGYTSTTVSPDTAASFAQLRATGRGDGLAPVSRTEAPSGNPVVFVIMVYPSDRLLQGSLDVQELILLRGGQYRVVGVDGATVYLDHAPAVADPSGHLEQKSVSVFGSSDAARFTWSLAADVQIHRAGRDTKGIRRFVRTAAGHLRYGEQIDELIVPDLIPGRVRTVRPLPPISPGINNPDAMEVTPEILASAKAAYEMTDRHTGLSVQVAGAKYLSPGRLKVMGRILGPDGQKAGLIENILEVGGEPPSAFHGMISIDSRYQGQGFGERFLLHEEAAYRSLGIERIDLLASLNVGGYAWARAGFDWKNEPGQYIPPWRDATNNMRYLIDKEQGRTAAELDLLRDMLARFEVAEADLEQRRLSNQQPATHPAFDPPIPQLTLEDFAAVDLPTPAELAMLGAGMEAPGQVPIGKRLMLMSHWSGRKTLVPLGTPAMAGKALTGNELARARFLAAAAEKWWRACAARNWDLGDDGLDWASGTTTLEEKRAIPRVRTPEGVRKYDLPLSAPIIARPGPKKSRKFLSLFNLNDRRGGFEKQLRVIANAVGVDPYDVNVRSLSAHARQHAKERRSRLPTKSPCWASHRVDFIVHRWLPGILREKYPRLAQQLLDTSPRWGRLSNPGGAVPLPEAKSAATLVRHVRTPEGRRKYGQEIGEVIVPDLLDTPWGRLQSRAVFNPRSAPSPRYWLRTDGMWVPVAWHEDAFPHGPLPPANGQPGAYRAFADETNAVRVTIASFEASINIFNPMTPEQIEALSTIRRPSVLIAPEGPRTGGKIQRVEDSNPENLRAALEWANRMLRGTSNHPSRLAQFKSDSPSAFLDEIDRLQTKRAVPHVRTPAGREKYGQPIGTPIILRPDTPTGSMMHRLAKQRGFTIHPSGVEPKTGYAVAKGGHSSITPAAEFFASEEAAAKIIDAWLKKHASVFDNDQWHIGGWYDTEHDEIVLDPSQVVAHLDEARILGVNRNEQSIFDLKNKVEIQTGGSGGREEKSYPGREGSREGAARHGPADQKDLRDDRRGADGVLPSARRDDVRPGREEAEEGSGVLGALARVVEVKRVRRVRTPEGRDKYDQEIGTVIVPDLLPRLSRLPRPPAPATPATTTYPGVGGQLSTSRPTTVTETAAYVPGATLPRMSVDLIGDAAFPSLIARQAGVPGFGDLAGRTDRAVLGEIIDRQAAAIVAAVDRSMAISPDATALHAGWYPFAHQWLTDLAAENHTPPDAVFAATAALSPSTDWPSNVAWAQNMTRMIANEKEIEIPISWAVAWHAARVKSWENAKAKIEKKGGTYNTAFPDFPKHIVGKKLADLSDADAAIAIRAAHDAAGRGPGAVRQLGGHAGFGNPKNLTRPQSDPNMIKAISILRDPSTANIDVQLGGNHKVRSFYANLRDPLDTIYLEVTADSHHYGLVNGHPWTSTGSVFLKSTPQGITQAPVTGTTGAMATYPLVVEATRRAALIVNAKYNTDWLPNQIQSVAWEQHKAEFPDAIRSNKVMQMAIEAAHAARARGEITPEAEWALVWAAMRGAGGPFPEELAAWYADDLAARPRLTLTEMRKAAAKAAKEAAKEAKGMTA